MLDGLTWKPIEGNVSPDDSLPYATHSGVLQIAEFSLRCYRLSNGMAVFDADDVNAFFGTMLAETATPGGRKILEPVD